MIITIGIDPGPTNCGLVVYDTERGRVLEAYKALSVDDALSRLEHLVCSHVAIERVQSYGIAGGSLLRTAEVCGRLQQRALDEGHSVTLHYRREVLRALDVTGKGNRDSLGRHRLIEMHGGTREAAVGTKKAPGPLYGVSSHAWQALAAAVCGGLE